METARTGRIKIDLAQLFEQQVEFFRRRTLGETTPAEQREYEKRRERIRQLFAEVGRLTKADRRMNQKVSRRAVISPTRPLPR